MTRLELVGLAATAVVLLGTPMAIFTGERFYSSLPEQHTITAHIAETGGFIPRQTVVHQGEHVRLRVTSSDVAHGFAVRELNIEIPVILPGKYVTVEFTPDKPGRYPFICTVICSIRHGEMQGEIVVLPAGAPADAGAAAVPAQGAASPSVGSAQPPGGPEVEAAGQAVYTKNCVACHGADAAGGLKLGAVTSADVRWTALSAAFGGDRELIRRAILAGKDAQGKDLNPAMPRWQGQLTDAQTDAVIAYLASLH